MNRNLKVGIGVVLGAIGVVLVAWFMLTHDVAVLNPEGQIGEKQRDLLVIATLLGLIVIVPVFVMTAMIAWKYRAGNTKAKYEPDWDHSRLFETIWWGVPIAIILVLGVITWKSSHDLDPYRALDSEVKPLRVQVIAMQWKWLFIYPEQQIASVNYLHIPEKTPINFEITSDAPMNAFWIPKLGSQVYAMSGMTTKLHLIANNTGTYQGSSANISGEGFADMVFTTKASSRDEFDIWVGQTQARSKSLDAASYDELARPAIAKENFAYSLGDDNLYDRVIMKYMAPATSTSTADEHAEGHH